MPSSALDSLLAASQGWGVKKRPPLPPIPDPRIPYQAPISVGREDVDALADEAASLGSDTERLIAAFGEKPVPPPKPQTVDDLYSGETPPLPPRPASMGPNGVFSPRPLSVPEPPEEPEAPSFVGNENVGRPEALPRKPTFMEQLNESPIGDATLIPIRDRAIEALPQSIRTLYETAKAKAEELIDPIKRVVGFPLRAIKNIDETLESPIVGTGEALFGQNMPGHNHPAGASLDQIIAEHERMRAANLLGTGETPVKSVGTLEAAVGRNPAPQFRASGPIDRLIAAARGEQAPEMVQTPAVERIAENAALGTANNALEMASPGLAMMLGAGAGGGVGRKALDLMFQYEGAKALTEGVGAASVPTPEGMDPREAQIEKLSNLGTSIGSAATFFGPSVVPALRGKAAEVGAIREGKQQAITQGVQEAFGKEVSEPRKREIDKLFEEGMAPTPTSQYVRPSVRRAMTEIADKQAGEYPTPPPPKPEGWERKAWSPELAEPMPPGAAKFMARAEIAAAEAAKQKADVAATSLAKSQPGAKRTPDPRQLVLLEELRAEKTKASLAKDYGKVAELTKKIEQIAGEEPVFPEAEPVMPEKGLTRDVGESVGPPGREGEVIQPPLPKEAPPGGEPPAAPAGTVAAVPPTPPAPPPAAPARPTTIEEMLNGPATPTRPAPPPTAIVPPTRVAKGIVQPGLPVVEETAPIQRKYTPAEKPAEAPPVEAKPQTIDDLIGQLTGGKPEPKVEVVEPGKGPQANASGAEQGAGTSLEAENRFKNQKFGIVDRGGNVRPLVDATGVDARPSANEAKVIIKPDGTYKFVEGNQQAFGAIKPAGPRSQRPDSTINVGRGMDGNVRVVFKEPTDKDVFRALARDQKEGRPKNPGMMRDLVARIARQTGALDSEIFEAARRFREDVLAQTKGKGEGDVVEPPKSFMEYLNEARQTKAAEAPPAAAAPPEAPKPAPAPAPPEDSVITRGPTGQPAVVKDTTPRENPKTGEMELDPDAVLIRDTSVVGVDPKVYQFKESEPGTGVTGALAGVKEWDPNSPPVLIHQRADGSLWIADGHQRFAKYNELKAQGKQLPPLKARIVREADGYTVDVVRRAASLQNVQEGSATPMDIAKLLRTGPLSAGELDRIPKGAMTGARLRHGQGLSELSEEAFREVINGTAHPEAVSQVAKYFTDPAEQVAAIRMIGKKEITNPNVGEAYAKELAKGMLEKKLEDSQARLPGMENDQQFIDLADVRAKLVTATERMLVKRKGFFNSALKGAPELENAGNRLDPESNQKIASDTAKILAYFEKFADSEGSATNTAIRELARDIYAKRIDPKAATDQLVDAIRRDIETGGTGAGEAAPGAAEGQPARPGADGQLAQGPEAVPPVAQPDASLKEVEEILRKGAEATAKDAPPLADIPLTLTGEKATEGMGEPTKKELEAAGQTDMFAEPEKPAESLDDLLQNKRFPRVQPERFAELTKRGAEKRAEGGGLEPVSPDERARLEGMVAVPNREVPAGKVDEILAATERAKQAKFKPPAKPQDIEEAITKPPRTYRESTTEEYQAMTRARNRAIDAATQRGTDLLKKVRASKAKAEGLFEQGGAQAVIDYWNKVTAEIEKRPVTNTEWTPPERIADNAEVIAPPNKDFVIVRFEGRATPEQSADLKAAGFKFKDGEWIGNVEGPTNRVGRPREDLIRDAKAIANPEAEGQPGDFYGSEEEPVRANEPAPNADTKPIASSTSSPVQPPVEAPKAETPKAAVKMMLTTDERQQLADLGYSRAEIDKMKPDEGAAILAAGTTKPRPTVEEVAQKPTIETPEEQTTVGEAVQKKIDEAIEKLPDEPAPKKELDTLLEGKQDIYDQLPANVRSYLTKRAELSREDINNFGSVEEAVEYGKKYGENERAKAEEAKKEAARAAAGQPKKLTPIEDLANPKEPLDPKVEQWARLIEKKLKGEKIENEEEYGAFLADEAERMAKSKAIMDELRAIEEDRKVPLGEEGRLGPIARPETVAEAQELADRFKTQADEGAPVSPREMMRQAREREALLANGSPLALRRYAEFLSKLYARLAAKGERGGTATRKVEAEVPRTESGELIGSGFGALEGMITLAKKNPAAFKRIMAAAGVGGLIGASKDDEDRVMGFLMGAAAGATAGAMMPANIAQYSKWKAAAEKLRLAGREPGNFALRRGPNEARDLKLWQVLLPLNPETVVPEAYTKATRIMDELNNEMAYGKLASETRATQKSVSGDYVKEAVRSLRELAKEATDAGLSKKGIYISRMADALAKKPTKGQLSAMEFAKTVGLDKLVEKAGGKLGYDWIERGLGITTYRILTGYALDTSLQNLTQPVLALRHVGTADLLWAYKVSRTQWARDMTRHIHVIRPTDLEETSPGVTETKEVSKPSTAMDWIKDPQRLIAKSDNFNRRVVYLAAMRAAERNGLMGDYAREWARAVNEQTFTEAYRTEADQWARSVMRDTQGDIGPLSVNPLYRGPIGGSIRPFTKFPTLLFRNLVDMAFQPDATGRNRFVMATAAAVFLGKQLGLDLEDTLLMGGRPFGMNVLKPKESLQKIMALDTFPVAKGVGDVIGHLKAATGGQPMNHPVFPTSLDDFFNSDFSYGTLGRYGTKVGSFVKRTIDEGAADRVVRTPSGAVKTITTLEDLIGLSGFKASRPNQLAKVTSEASGEMYQAAADRKAKAKEIVRQMRVAYDAHDTAKLAELQQKLATTTRSSKAVINAMQGIDRTQWERILRQADPRTRALLNEKYGDLIEGLSLSK